MFRLVFYEAETETGVVYCKNTKFHMGIFKYMDFFLRNTIIKSIKGGYLHDYCNLR